MSKTKRRKQAGNFMAHWGIYSILGILIIYGD